MNARSTMLSAIVVGAAAAHGGEIGLVAAQAYARLKEIVAAKSPGIAAVIAQLEQSPDAEDGRRAVSEALDYAGFEDDMEALVSAQQIIILLGDAAAVLTGG